MSHPREQKGASSLFQPAAAKIPDKLPVSWDKLPVNLQQLVATFLDPQTLASLSIASQSSKELREQLYRRFYPVVKKAMVKLLRKLVEEDDTVRVRQLLQINPNLNLRSDALDPAGMAYAGVLTTPYQDSWADPFQEEMRQLQESFFPKEKLSEAARQAHEFMNPPDLPEFERLRLLRQRQISSLKKIVGLNQFAYDTYLLKQRTWIQDRGNVVLLHQARDAWMRVSVVQDFWSKRLRKISSALSMHPGQTFNNLPQDLAEPHFNRDPRNLWLPSSVKKGCDIKLISFAAGQDIDRDQLNELTGNYGHPVLIRRGDGEEKTTSYYLYAPRIHLDQDRVDWDPVLIDDPKVLDLIRSGAIDFNAESGTLAYSPNFDALYNFGARHSLHLGSGFSHPFAALNFNGCAFRASPAAEGTPECVVALPSIVVSNLAAVTALYTKRLQNREDHLQELGRHLQRPAGPAQKRGPG